MPMKLNVGVSRKVGLPEYSSAGASCNVELELDSVLLQNDVHAFQDQVREAFAAAEQAVEAEVARLQGAPGGSRLALPAPRNGTSRVHHTNGNSSSVRANGTSVRNGTVPDRLPTRCTAKQVRAIRAIARNLRINLEDHLRHEFGVEAPDELTLAQASELIDELRASSEG